MGPGEGAVALPGGLRSRAVLPANPANLDPFSRH
jgi:hypothetical protein